MSKRIKAILILIIVLVITILSYFAWTIYAPVSSATNDHYFVVEKGEGVKVITKHLEREGLIKSDFNTRTYLWLKGLEGQLKAGTYKLNNHMSTRQVIKALVAGDPQEEVTVKIIEGWTNKEIGEYLEGLGLFPKEEFWQATLGRSDLAFEYNFLNGDNDYDLQGFLFPDTYRVYKDAKPEDIIRRMLDNFENKVSEDLRKEAVEKNITLHQAITMASIVEKEVPDDSNRQLVANIFYKRLNINMALQSDATVNYATGKSALQPTYDDLAVDSPYNTYKYQGLPPGPINNPSLSAITASIRPVKNDYWYFLTTKEGEVIYSMTGEEHLENKAKYLK